MAQYDEKVLASLIKQASKSRLIWKKSPELELVTNGHWAVMVPEIKELKVRVSLYAAFGQEIKNSVITITSGEITHRDLEESDFDLFAANSATDVGTITPITLLSSEEVSQPARIIHFGSELMAIPEEQLGLVDTKTAYRWSKNRKSLIFLGDEKEVCIAPLLGADWRELIYKYAQML